MCQCCAPQGTAQDWPRCTASSGLSWPGFRLGLDTQLDVSSCRLGRRGTRHSRAGGPGRFEHVSPGEPVTRRTRWKTGREYFSQNVLIWNKRGAVCDSICPPCSLFPSTEVIDSSIWGKDTSGDRQRNTDPGGGSTCRERKTDGGLSTGGGRRMTRRHVPSAHSASKPLPVTHTPVDSLPGPGPTGAPLGCR